MSGDGSDIVLILAGVVVKHTAARCESPVSSSYFFRHPRKRFRWRCRAAYESDHGYLFGPVEDTVPVGNFLRRVRTVQPTLQGL